MKLFNKLKGSKKPSNSSVYYLNTRDNSASVDNAENAPKSSFLPRQRRKSTNSKSQPQSATAVEMQQHHTLTPVVRQQKAVRSEAIISDRLVEKKREYEQLSVDLRLEEVGSVANQLLKMVRKKWEMAKNGDLKSLIVFITVISSVMALLGVFEELLNYVAACAYPIYMSFKTLNNNDIEESRRWLVYWIVFGATRILKSVLYPIIKLIPYFAGFELLLLIWLYHDATNGAKIVYEKYLYPVLKKHEEKIDQRFKVHSPDLMKKLMD